MNCQDHLYRDADPRQVSRRWFLQECGVGLGAMALGQLLREASAGSGRRGVAQPAGTEGSALSPRRPSGSSSCSWPGRRATWSCSTTSRSSRSSTAPCRRRSCSRAIVPRSSTPTRSCSGRSSSSPGTDSAEPSSPNCCRTWRTVVDDIAVVKWMVTDAFNHAPGQIMMSTGSQIFGRPSMGAWVTLWPGERVAGPARVRRLQHGQEGPQRRQFELGERVPAHGLPGGPVPHQRRPGALSLQSPRGRRGPPARLARRRRQAQPDAPRRSRATPRSPRGSTRSRWPSGCSSRPPT